MQPLRGADPVQELVSGAAARFGDWRTRDLLIVSRSRCPCDLHRVALCPFGPRSAVAMLKAGKSTQRWWRDAYAHEIPWRTRRGGVPMRMVECHTILA